MTELKPCPFCGGTPELILESIKLEFGHTCFKVLVRCPECETNKFGTGFSKYRIGVDMPIEDLFNTVNQATESAEARWNGRAET